MLLKRLLTVNINITPKNDNGGTFFCLVECLKVFYRLHIAPATFINKVAQLVCSLGGETGVQKVS